MKKISAADLKKVNGGDSHGSGLRVRYYVTVLFWSVPVYGPQY